MKKIHGPIFLLAAAALLVFGAPAMAADAEASLTPDALTLQIAGDHDGGQLVVSGPGGRMISESFEGSTATLPLSNSRGALPDGTYTWEATLSPRVTNAQRALLDELRASGDRDRLIELREAGALPEGSVHGGSFTLKNGLPVDSTLVEGQGVSPEASRGVLADPATGFLAEEQVITGDLTVRFSLCVGGDCVNAESFGADTIRLKENNLRVHFNDTSNSASFPTADWRLTANDSSNGGESKFTIDDVDNGRVPFTVRSGAPSHSLYVATNGSVGFGTSTPVVEMHSSNGDTPTLRLEQNGSAGFQAQTWDLAGNETNFFVRDVSNGSKLPFRIFPTAADDGLVMRNSRVGINTDNPSEMLHLRNASASSSARILIQEASASAGNSVLLRATNSDGNVQTEFEPSGGVAWRQNFRNQSFDIDFQDASGDDEFSLTTDGDLIILRNISATNGTVSAMGVVLTSDRNTKQDIVPVQGTDVLAKISQLPVSTWTFKTDADSVLHMGPMAQDFHAAFGLGPDDKHISPQDTASVALVGVQAVNQRLESEVEALRAANAALLERLEALEAKLEE